MSRDPFGMAVYPPYRRPETALKPIIPPALPVAAERSGTAEGERTHNGSTVDTETISADRGSSQAVPALGCRYCGVEQRAHCQRWTVGVGYHGWTEPTREQIRERMRARLTAAGRLPRPGGPLPAGEPALLGAAGYGLTLDIDTSGLRPAIITQTTTDRAAPLTLTAMRDAMRRLPMVLPYAPEECVRVEMHPDLIATLAQRGEARANPGPGLLGVPIAPDPDLPPDGWRSYDRDGQVIGQHPPATARPRPAPRPPWWRRQLDRIRRTDRKD